MIDGGNRRPTDTVYLTAFKRLAKCFAPMFAYLHHFCTTPTTLLHAQ